MDAAISPLGCFGTRRQTQAPQRDDGRGEDEAKKAFLGTTCACCAALFHHKTDTAPKMPVAAPRRWLRGMNRVFARSSHCGLKAVADGARVVEPRLQTGTTTAAQEEEEEEGDQAAGHAFSREYVAAATIQACFRGHLARRAFRALRSLVKLQAFARGSYVRKQVDVAIRCMRALVRLQVRVRARQLLDMSKDD